jgi:O-antigen ligase
VSAYRFRLVTAGCLLGLLAFAILAFGATVQWALMVFEIGVFLLSAVWAFRIALRVSHPVWNPFYLPIGLLAGWTWLQYAAGLSVYEFPTASEAFKWLAFALMFFVAAQVLFDAAVRRFFGRSWVWLLSAVCVFGLIQHFTSRGLLYWSLAVPVGRIFGPFVNANHFTALLELVIPTAVLLAVKQEEQRLVYVAVVMVLLASTVVCASRVGIVLVGLEVIIVLAVEATRPSSAGAQPLRRRWMAASALATAAILGGLVLQREPLLERFREPQPYEVRWTIVQGTWGLFLSRPWTGYGAGTFSDVYPSAARIHDGLSWSHAHNDPIQFAMEWGVLGPLALAWILLLLLRRRWTRDQWLRAVLPAASVLVHSWFDFPLQIPAVAAAWLLTLAMLPPRPESHFSSGTPAPSQA